MTNLKTVEEVVNSVKWGWECNENNIAELLTQDRQSVWDELVRLLESKRNQFVPADQVWEGDEEQEVGEWKFVPKKDGLYCLNCERFTPEEGCLCNVITIDQALTIVKEVYKGNN